jgi:hypothetical protein
MTNPLGIYSANFPQGPIIPSELVYCNGVAPVIQVVGNNNGFSGGFANSGNFVGTVGFSVTASDPQVITVADGLTPVSAMTLTPGAGTFQTTFNANYSLLPVPVADITAQAAADVVTLVSTIAALPGGILHGAVFGNGEILTPGVYDVVTPASIQGILTLDAQGDPDAVFVFRINGALTSVAASQVLLVNGANPANIFWESLGATALGANTVFAGTAVAVVGAASIGNGSTMTGRLLSTTGAITTDTNVPITVPSGPGPASIPLGVLSTFALFTANGGVSNTGTSLIVGDIGTNVGAIAGYGLPTIVVGNIYTPGSPGAGVPVSVTFGIYANGVLVPNSQRTITSDTPIISDIVNLAATATVLAGQAITVRAQVLSGVLTVNNRILSVIKVG